MRITDTSLCLLYSSAFFMVCLLVLYQYSAGLLWITVKSVTFLNVLALGEGVLVLFLFKGNISLYWVCQDTRCKNRRDQICGALWQPLVNNRAAENGFKFRVTKKSRFKCFLHQI